MGRRDRAAAFLARGGAKPPRAGTARARRPPALREGRAERAIRDAQSALDRALEAKTMASIGPRLLGEILELAVRALSSNEPPPVCEQREQAAPATDEHNTSNPLTRGEG